MPRTARASVGGICYYVIKRGNAQIEVFHKDGDFAALIESDFSHGGPAWFERQPKAPSTTEKEIEI